jgi:uncharacterized membrane-anchored protein
MDIQSFYALMAATCFGLVGLWWNVVRAKPEWTKDAQLRTLAGGVYLSFLIPGLMSLVAQVSDGSPLIWRVAFGLAAGMGIYYTTRLIRKTRGAAPKTSFYRNRWGAVVIYVFILIFALLPGLALFIGLLPLQMEAILLAGLILIAHGLAWDFLTAPTPEKV